MKNIELRDAYVLHRRPFRDTSLLVDLWVREEGVVTVVARSARGPKSRFRGLLQLFQPLKVAFGGRGQLQNLSKLECFGAPHLLRGQQLFSALYMNELILRLASQSSDAMPDVYDRYQQSLHEIQAGDLEWPLRLLERDLLQAMGYAIPLRYESQSGLAICADSFYKYIAGEGYFVLRESGAEDLFSGASLLAFADGVVEDDNQRRDIKRLMRVAISEQLGRKGLNIRKWMNMVK